MTTLFRSVGLWALVAGGGLFVACGDDAGPSDQAGDPDAPVAADRGGDNFDDALADDAEGEDVYTYNPIGKRDPFRSFISGPREDDIRSPTPLQRWDIDQFLLVGIVWGVDQPKAMVEDPENQSHVLEIGTYIGRNWGKVTQVTADSVVVTEEYQTIEGELVTEQVTLSLPLEDLQE